MDFELIILGAGAAGMMAAVAFGEERLAELTPTPRMAILEKNARPGIKVLVCGGGRCNLTNAGSQEFLIRQFGRNGRFLTPALRHFDNDALRAWFAARGVPTHEEHDGKIYPDSNQAKSVVDALAARMAELGVASFAGPGCAAAAVRKLAADEPDAPGFAVTLADGRTLGTRLLLLTVGGQSYTRMGTTGDGYRFAQALGHTIVTPRPAIVPLLCQQSWVAECQGVAVQDVEVRIEAPGPLPRLATGKPTPSINDLMFTHFGLSGPAVLNISEIVAELLERFEVITLRIDLLRHHPREQLAAKMRQWQSAFGRRLPRTMLAGLIPQCLADVLCRLAGIGETQTCAVLTAAQMHHLIESLKSLRFTVHQTRGFKEAMVTAGGVSLAEVNPDTMESRVCPGLFIAGEVLDLTGPSGGYNLQLAFSTGRLAGVNIARLLVAATHGA